MHPSVLLTKMVKCALLLYPAHASSAYLSLQVSEDVYVGYLMAAVSVVSAGLLGVEYSGMDPGLQWRLVQVGNKCT
jgi:hypothetical protein